MSKLVGKTIWFHLTGRVRCGFYSGKITKVWTVKDKKSKKEEIRFISVKRFSPATGRWNGQRYKLKPNEWGREWCGVYHYNRLRKPEEFL